MTTEPGRPPGRDPAFGGKYLAEVKQAAQGTIIGEHAQVTQSFQVAIPPPGPSADLVMPVPRQLPAATRHFAGRVAELELLTSLMEETAEASGTVVISAIDGTAGIGKTALAVSWAHRVADRFPDGQLYVNLRGFDPTGSAMTPAEAVRDFLGAFE
ncbi:MAG TPA: SARP family transcriptional regulator, partial [Actinomycetota bacterium]